MLKLLAAYIVTLLSVAGICFVALFFHPEFRFRITEKSLRIFGQSRVVLIGDSVVRQGGCWAWRLRSADPLACNLGVSGFLSFQVEKRLQDALKLNPEYIVLFAGFNDLPMIIATGEDEYTKKAFESMIGLSEESGAKLIVNLLPFRSGEQYRKATIDLNQFIERLALRHELPLIDLNQRFSPNGEMLDEYTTDGLHFTESAYVEWAKEITQVIDGSEQP